MKVSRKISKSMLIDLFHFIDAGYTLFSCMPQGLWLAKNITSCVAVAALPIDKSEK